MTTDFNMKDFLEEGRKAAALAEAREARYSQHRKNVPSLPKKELLPNALVQITVKTHCYGCGTDYYHPNRKLSIRYGSQIVHIKTWHQEYADLSRETIELEEKAPACSTCFLERIFVFSEEAGI